MNKSGNQTHHKHTTGRKEKKHFLELAFESKMRSMQEPIAIKHGEGIHTIGIKNFIQKIIW